MRRITIDIQGGDSAHRARLREHTTRPVLFPDGVTRLITARTVLWESLAKIQEAYAFTDEEFAERVYAHAVEDAAHFGTTLEAEIQWCWTTMSRQFWRGYFASRDTTIAANIS